MGHVMSSSWKADNLIATHSTNTERYKRNLLRQAVCEFKFPTLMELGGDRPPASFVSALRKDYPTLETVNEYTLGVGAGAASSKVHIFRSNKLTWTVSLKENAITIETTAYTQYPVMKKRIMQVLDAAAKVIDSEFFTRVGIRYVNVIDRVADPVRENWINPDLVAPIRSNNFKSVQQYAGKMLLSAEDGGCLLQHGVQTIKGSGQSTKVEYVLDIDVFRNEVELSKVEYVLEAIHVQAFDVFDWSIGPAARDYLSS